MLVNCAVYQDGKRLAEITKREIKSYLSRPDCFVWVALFEPSPEELDEMAEEFGLHELAVDDARHGHQRPKIEEYGDSLFAVLHTLENVTTPGGDEELLAGEIALSRGDRKGAIGLFRAAAASEAKVNYAEPPDWDLPIREWLGRALMLDGQFAEAEKTYREEIARSPRNGRALFGLAEALAKQGKNTSAELVRKEFEAAWKDADHKLSTEMFIPK